MTRLLSIFKPLLLSVLFFGVWTAGAQTQRVTLSDKSLTVLQALSQIERQTRMSVAYNSRMFDNSRTVVFPAQEISVDEAMRAVTAGTNFTYSFNGNMIVVTRKADNSSARPSIIPAGGYVPSAPADFENFPNRRPGSASRAAADTIYTIVRVERQVDPVRDPVSNIRPIGEYSLNQGALPRFTVKTNLLYGLGTLTPNLTFELGTGKKTSLQISGSYNPWNLSGSLESNKKLVHMIVKPEFRWWPCERFNGHFFDFHAFYWRYNIGSYQIPLLFDKQYRYDGWAVGAGVGYGYNWAFAKRWGLELGIGVGVAYMDYDRYACSACNRDSQPFTKVYFGPTEASISLVFLIK